MKKFAPLLGMLGTGFVGGELIHGMLAVIGMGVIGGLLGYSGLQKFMEMRGDE